MDLNKTQEQIEKEIEQLFPNLPQFAIESLSYLTSVNYRLQKELNSSNVYDEAIRLECLKLAAPLHPRINGFGEYVSCHNNNIPRFVQLDADKYLAYIKEGHVADERKK